MKKTFTITFTEEPDGTFVIGTSQSGFSFFETIGLLDIARQKIMEQNIREDEKSEQENEQE